MRILAYILLIAGLVAGAYFAFVHGGQARREIHERAAVLEQAAKQTNDLLKIKSPPSPEELASAVAAVDARRERLDAFIATLARGARAPAPSVDDVLARARKVGVGEALLRALADSLTSTAAATLPESRRRAVAAFLDRCDGNGCQLTDVTLDAAAKRAGAANPFELVRLRASLVGSPSAVVDLFDRLQTPRLDDPADRTVVGDVARLSIRALDKDEIARFSAKDAAPPIAFDVEVDFVTGTSDAAGGAP